MNIDVGDRRCIPFYHELRQLGMVLLCHTGEALHVLRVRATKLTLTLILTVDMEEHSVDAGGCLNELGNPLRLRPAPISLTLSLALSLNLNLNLNPFECRLPLELGVTVIAAHCASEGMCEVLGLGL